MIVVERLIKENNRKRILEAMVHVDSGTTGESLGLGESDEVLSRMFYAARDTGSSLFDHGLCCRGTAERTRLLLNCDGTGGDGGDNE